MTWTTYHRREDALRDVIAAVDARADGRLPMDLPGVSETFGDAKTLLGALQLRWHARLVGHLDVELAAEPLELEDAVVAAWRASARDLPGVRAILDRERTHPSTPAVAEVMARATAKERTLLATTAGRVSTPGASAVRAGAEIEDRARRHQDCAA